MFLGHIGVGLIAKRSVSRVPIAILLPVALLPDILSIPGIIAGSANIDPVPWTHGLFMTLVWMVATFFTSLAVSKNLRISILIGSLIGSHWILDFIAWPMDFGRGLPLLFSGSPEIGLGLYSTTAGSLIGEITGLIFVGFMIYFIRNRRSKSKKTDVVG